MATCRCGAQCQGGLCEQCAIEETHADLADEVASECRWSDDGGEADE